MIVAVIVTSDVFVAVNEILSNCEFIVPISNTSTVNGESCVYTVPVSFIFVNEQLFGVNVNDLKSSVSMVPAKTIAILLAT